MRWITDRLGTAAFGDPEIPATAELLDVRHLVDKSGNDPEAIRAAIDSGTQAIMENKHVIVCCDYGRSRSNAIAAGIVHRTTSLSPGDSLRFVIDATGETSMKVNVIDAVLGVLANERKVRTDQKRILMTGGSGALGSAFVRQARHDEVILAPSRADLDMDEGAGALNLFAREHEVETILHFANPRMYVTNKAVGVSHGSS